MAGVLVTSIGSGQLISRIGRYKPFPIVGTALMTVGLFLLAGRQTLDATGRRRSTCSCSAWASAW